MSNVKVEKQEPQGPSSPGAFEEWYDTKFKHGFERGPNDKYVARKAWFAALYTAPQPCPECEKLKAELERERMRLAACGVVAMSNTEESAKQARQMHPDYESASCADVARAVDSEIQLRKERNELAEQVEKMLNPADVLLEIVGRIQPFALPREEDTQQKRYERLRKAYCIAQPWPIPDQACLVWRADLMHMAGDLVHKQAYFDNEKRKRDSALAADMEAGRNV